MFFNLFGLFFSKYSFLRLQNFISPSIKYSINLIFEVVVCSCKIHVFNGIIPCQKHTKFLVHFTLFWKFSAVVCIIEICKPWKYWPLTPSISELMVFLKNGKLARLGWHFKYYFFFDNFCFKKALVLKTHRGMFFDSRNSRIKLKLPYNILVLGSNKILSKSFSIYL